MSGLLRDLLLCLHIPNCNHIGWAAREKPSAIGRKGRRVARSEADAFEPLAGPRVPDIEIIALFTVVPVDGGSQAAVRRQASPINVECSADVPFRFAAVVIQIVKANKAPKPSGGERRAVARDCETANSTLQSVPTREFGSTTRHPKARLHGHRRAPTDSCRE